MYLIIIIIFLNLSYLILKEWSIFINFIFFYNKKENKERNQKTKIKIIT